MQLTLFLLDNKSSDRNVEQRSDLGQWVDRFVRYCETTRGLSSHTVRAYGTDLRTFHRHAGLTEVAMLDRSRIGDHIQWLRTERRACAASVRRHVATLRLFCRWLRSEKQLEMNPFDDLPLGIKLPARLPRALEAVDMQLMFRTMRKPGCGIGLTAYQSLQMNAAVSIMFSTGVRLGELVAMRTRDVFLEDCAILVHGKGSRERRVYLPEGSASGSLAKLLHHPKVRHQDRVFVSAQGLGVSPQVIRSRLRRIAARAGLNRPVTPHMLRHTAATQLLDAGVDSRFVQRLLGHSSIATTQIYMHVTDRMLKMKLQKADTFRRLQRSYQ